MSGHSTMPSDRINKSQNKLYGYFKNEWNENPKDQGSHLYSEVVADEFHLMSGYNVLRCQVPFLLIYDMVPSYASLESIPSFWINGNEALGKLWILWSF
jgi:hypothetical protein